MSCRGRTELIAELLSTLSSSNLQQSVVLEQSCDLLERCHNYTNIGGGSEETTPSLSNNFEAFQGLVKSTQLWLEDLRQNVDSPLADDEEIRVSAEQRLHLAQVGTFPTV